MEELDADLAHDGDAFDLAQRSEEVNFLPRADTKRHNRLIKRLLIVAAVIVILITTAWIAARYLLSPVVASDDPEAYDPVTLEPKEPEGFFRRLTHFVFSKDVVLSGQRDDRINILLLGIGGQGHDGPYLSDTIILASIQPSTKRLALVSIPRDLLVDIPDYGPNKINAANAYGEQRKPGHGGSLATEVVEKTFDIDIPYYIRTDFDAFKELIDTVGGVRVNVERSFHDPLYPAANNAYQTVSFARGIQTMNGKMALQYARSRHGSNNEGSDFARARRQQKVILALKEKILSAGTMTNPIRIKSILDTLDAHVSTNMSFPDLLALIKMGRELNTDEITTLVLDTNEQGYLVSGSTDSGAFVLLPKSGNFKEIHAAIDHIFDTSIAEANDTPKQDISTITVTTSTGPVIEIQNGTWRAGFAARIKKRLTDKSFVVGAIGNTVERPVTAPGIYAIATGISPDVLASIESELHIPVRTDLASNISTASTTDILVILGEDMPEE